MKLGIKFFLGFIFIILTCWLFELFVIGSPIVILTSNIDMHHMKGIVGDTINPLNDLYFDNEDLAIYIIVNKNDRQDFDPQLFKGLYLKCNNKNILKDILPNFDCVVTGGDMATVQSAIYVVQNNEIVFMSGIVLDKNIAGLQNQHFGWAEAVDSELLLDACRKFKRSYWPILFL